MFVTEDFNASVEVEYMDEAACSSAESVYIAPSDVLIPALLYINRDHKVEDINDYFMANLARYERSIDSEGNFVGIVTNTLLIPCLDIYGDDPDLVGYFVDTYKDSTY